MVAYKPTNLFVRCSGAEMWLIHVFRWMLKVVARVFWVFANGVARRLLRCSGWLPMVLLG